jgi:hypothetical protein
MKPVTIHSVKAPPPQWQKLDIGGLLLTLPTSKYEKAKGEEDHILFYSRHNEAISFSLILPSEETTKTAQGEKPKYPPPFSFQEDVAIFSSTPDDVSFFHLPQKNISANLNQLFKLMAVPIGFGGGLRKILIVKTDNLNAICLLSEREKGYGSSVTVYSKNGDISFNLVFLRYKDLNTLDTEILTVLGGIRIPEKMPDRDQVSKDICHIVAEFNKTGKADNCP